jgi:hypothetical protein
MVFPDHHSLFVPRHVRPCLELVVVTVPCVLFMGVVGTLLTFAYSKRGQEPANPAALLLLKV